MSIVNGYASFYIQNYYYKSYLNHLLDKKKKTLSSLNIRFF